MRLSYACDCSGDEIVGRVNPDMTSVILKAVQTMTGTRVQTCPWRAYRDPFVQRVLSAMAFFESGQLEFAVPGASHRLVQGLGYYSRVDNAMHGKQMDQARDDRKRDAERQRMLADAGQRDR